MEGAGHNKREHSEDKCKRVEMSNKLSQSVSF
jgi:hypothetical protein